MFVFLAALALAATPPTMDAASSRATTATESPREIVVGSIDRATGEVRGLKRELVRTQFDDGTPVREASVKRQGKKYYLEIIGGAAGACKLQGVELVPSTDGQLRMKSTSATATCSGDPCSSCKFTYTNDVITGCKCADATGSGKCNHTISSQQFQLLRATARR
ncbi:MAG: hypothetical protein K2Q06_05375 [Parvularculaceae bacterium]|nr:hypothetical protein [Parvularculaceae bacterium]